MSLLKKYAIYWLILFMAMLGVELCAQESGWYVFDEASSQIEGPKLSEGSTLNVHGLVLAETNLAFVPPSGTASVRFSFDGGTARNENTAPYTLWTEKAGEGVKLREGQHTLRATAYSETKAKGKVLVTSEIRILVVESDPSDVRGPEFTAHSVETGSLFKASTDEAARVEFYFGKTAQADEGLLKSSAFSTSHQILLSSLQSSTRYFYRALAFDKNGNASMSAVTGSFETPEKPKYIFPDAAWQTATPEAMGFDGAKFNEAMKHFRSQFKGDQVAVVRSGHLIYRGSGSKKSFGIFSCTKSFTSTTLGLLVQDGKTSLDATPASFLSFLKSRYSGIQFRHLTTMTSGYDAQGGSYGAGSGDGSKTPFSPASPSFAPGSHYAYWDDAMNLYGLALSQVAGRNFSDVFRSRIASKIQMGSFSWSNNFSYGGKSIATGAGSGGGVKVHAEDFARFCYLALRKGEWKGEQLVRKEWFEAATRVVQVPKSMKVHSRTQNWIANGHYGYNWWINAAPGEEKFWPSVPHDTFAARGTRGNFCIVIPSLDLVITRVGNEGTNSNSVLDGILARIVGALR
jgi:CubicO group peptidase (beta-lactamase class C family)